MSSHGFLSSLDAARTRLGRWAREPLLQFLLVGLVLFAGYRAFHPTMESPSKSNVIELTPDDFVQMSVAWIAQGRPSPTPAQMQSLIELKVREEVLYREALALGLDKGDVIIKRRLAQKMEFLAEGSTDMADSSTEELKSWYKANAQRFALPPRASFRHLYFASDRKGGNVRAVAEQALGTLVGKPADWPGGAALADPFMFQDFYGDRSFDDMAKLFGPDFARSLFMLKPGAWQGPIESGYGWHLVFAETLTPSHVPAFEEIEPEIKAQWAVDKRESTKRSAIEAMRARYQVVFPEPRVK